MSGRVAHEAVVLAPAASARAASVEKLRLRVRSTIRGETNWPVSALRHWPNCSGGKERTH